LDDSAGGSQWVLASVIEALVRSVQTLTGSLSKTLPFTALPLLRQRSHAIDDT
jgi:hypothetical protein